MADYETCDICKEDIDYYKECELCKLIICRDCVSEKNNKICNICGEDFVVKPKKTK